MGGNFKNAKTGRLWPMGTVEWPSVSEMRRRIEALPKDRDKTQECPLQVIDNTDIGKYQASLCTDDKAMVQIASNFHCLENGNPRTPADCGFLVEGYAQDCTQGPAAAFGVPAASLLRAHYAFKAEGSPPEQWGQGSRDVNLLEDICGEGNYCGTCINGKALLLGKEKAIKTDEISDCADQVRIGLHCDAQVVFTRGAG